MNGMEIRYGAKNIESNDGTVVGASAIYEHYEFVRSSLINDIAIIRTDRPIKMSDFAKPVCLPDKGEMVPIGQEAFVAGWGYMNEGAFWIQDKAREVMVPIVTDSQGLRFYLFDFIHTVYSLRQCYVAPRESKTPFISEIISSKILFKRTDSLVS